jgi:caa(3)-type oxidase subunit IV
MQERSARPAGRWQQYAVVFLVLIVLTIVEVVIAGGLLAPPVLNIVLLGISVSKAALVAAFYMHLRGESRLYMAIFVLPVLLLMVFAILSVLI